MRETFGSRFGAVMALIGVAVGLGDVWRFPYMVGQFGGATFVLLYLALVLLVGIPGLMAEFALGRHTRRGPIGAYAAAGLPLGRFVGWFFFLVVAAATAYYTAVIGWVLYYNVAEIARAMGRPYDPALILPPDAGFESRSFVRQLVCTGAVIAAYAFVQMRGLRAGIERASRIIMPALFVILLVLVARALTLPGAMAGVHWYILKFNYADLNASVVMAALGHVMFSLSLGGTFMVLYGSYLDADVNVRSTAVWTAMGDTAAGFIAGFAIIPAVFALGLEPGSGPGLLFATLPAMFAAMPAGALFGFLFYAGLFGAAYLSGIAAVEALVAGLTDNTRITRTRAIRIVAGAVFLIAIPPSINNGIFIPWDLTFGSGMQTLGALLAIITLGWCMSRSAALAELSSNGAHDVPVWLIYWIRFFVPAVILSVGIWWLLTSVIGTATAV